MILRLLFWCNCTNRTAISLDPILGLALVQSFKFSLVKASATCFRPTSLPFWAILLKLQVHN
jgi:hypothetical protein